MGRVTVANVGDALRNRYWPPAPPRTATPAPAQLASEPEALYWQVSEGDRH
ncbi:hypothetical protein [Actinoplanes regularis]|uniref:Uncharacterized protein n=1 Tax=Actinoplanes regularis TaxID=52697 RepID=A0A239FKR5_9ACTN|nr:hypothetical protein [Actinoplanes regularis]GIE89653.1 hypothetical protein Are01nite_61330 [Actinoplanes regularis]SNS57499.1 hypothetical protein SAMN06264365_118134 [Actinoplanes regularis]